MKRSLFFAIILSMLCLACSKYQEQDGVPSVSQYGELIARFAEDTRTYAEQGKYLRWHEADLLSVFYGSTANVGYKFNGKTGDSDGRFALILGETTGENNPLDRIYAIYPMRSLWVITLSPSICLLRSIINLVHLVLTPTLWLL